MSPHAALEPSPFVVRWLGRLPPGARVLDVACGHGRHVRAAIEHGLRVTAVDRDADAIAALPDGVESCVADIEAAAWPLPGRRFDAVIVARYLHRPLFDVLLAALDDGGLYVHETFAEGQAAFGRPSNPAFLLTDGELLDRVRPACHVLAFEDGVTADAQPARLQRIAAVKLAADPQARAAQLRRCVL